MAFSPKVALGRGLWPAGQMKGLPAFLALLDQLHEDGYTTLQLATVYDCGATSSTYNPSFLFSGLAGSNYSAVNPNIGGEAEWMTFIEHAHSLNITVTVRRTATPAPQLTPARPTCTFQFSRATAHRASGTRRTFGPARRT